MFTTILWIYLGGFVALEGKTVIDNYDKNGSRVTTRGEDIAIETVVNIAWPIAIPFAITKKIKDSK